MNAIEAKQHAKKMAEHIRSLDSASDDWKCIHALLVMISVYEDALNKTSSDAQHALDKIYGG